MNQMIMYGVEAIEPGWRTSTYSDGLQCVAVKGDGDGVLFRDSKDPAGPMLHFTRGEMGAFLAGAKAGEFDDLA